MLGCSLPVELVLNSEDKSVLLKLMVNVFIEKKEKQQIESHNLFASLMMAFSFDIEKHWPHTQLQEPNLRL